MQLKGRRSVGSNIYFERISNSVGLLDESIGTGGHDKMWILSSTI